MFKLISFSSKSGGLVDAQKVFDKLKVLMGDIQIKDLPIKYRAIATDLNTQKEVLFEKGSLIDAIRALVGIPLNNHLINLKHILYKIYQL